MFLATIRSVLKSCFLFAACDGVAFSVAAAEDKADQAAPSVVKFKDEKPVVTAGMLFGPTFQMKSDKTSGGVMFAARLPDSDRPILLSAMHLFGPATGMDKQLSVDEITKTWQSVKGDDLVDDKTTSFSGLGLALPGASAEFEPSPAGDVVVFVPQENRGLKPITISAEVPKEGDVVWLLSHTLAGDSLAHRAVCLTIVHENFLVYRFDEPIGIAGTSGGAIVNERGFVVAVQRGGGSKDGKTLGAGSLASRFLPILTRELKAKSATK
jgi:hypothetical protein